MPNYSDVNAVFPLVAYPIVGVDTGTEEFVVDGDQTARFLVDDIFSVIDSTGNDGEYTVASRSYASGPDETTIVVNEDITDATVDGNILHDEKADTLPITESHDDTADRDAAAPDQYAGAHAKRLANELRALGKTLGQGLGIEIVDGGGLVVYHTGGTLIKGSGPPIDIAPGKLTLTDNQTNYVEVDIAGTVSSNTSAFSTGKYPLAIGTTVAGDIMSLVDKRSAIYLAEFAEANLDSFGPSFNAATELTIAAGVVTRTQGLHRIDTEGDAATDDLDTISGTAADYLLYIRSENAARVVTLKDSTGNLDLNGRDIVLNDPGIFICLVYDSVISKWVIAGGGNAGGIAPPSVDNRVVRVDGVAGDIQQAIGALLDDNDYLYDLVRIGIGGGASPPLYPLHLSDTSIDVSSEHITARINDTIIAGNDDYYGIDLNYIVSGGTPDDMYGIDCVGYNPSQDVGWMYGAYFKATQGASGTGNYLYGTSVNVSQFAGGVLDNDLYCLKLSTQVSGTVTGISYGLYHSISGALDYFIYQDDASDNYLGGALETIGILTASGGLSLGAPSELTLDASGIITITKGYHRVDTFGDAATDDLVTISGGVDGEKLIIRAENDARTVVAKDGTGNLALAGDFSLDNVEDTLTLIYDATLAKWLEVSRSDNGA